LSEQEIDVAAAIELGGILDAGIHPPAALHAIPAGKFVHLEQVRVVEDQALRVLVGKRAYHGFVWP
jgi:hypothetical protein